MFNQNLQTVTNLQKSTKLKNNQYKNWKLAKKLTFCPCARSSCPSNEWWWTHWSRPVRCIRASLASRLVCRSPEIRAHCGCTTVNMINNVLELKPPANCAISCTTIANNAHTFFEANSSANKTKTKKIKQIKRISKMGLMRSTQRIQ